MAEIARFYTWDRDEVILVPGITVEDVLKGAAGELDDDEVILTPSDEVSIDWWRTVPCHPTSCDEGPHRIHYIQTRGPSRGGFQAAAVEVALREEVTA